MPGEGEDEAVSNPDGGQRPAALDEFKAALRRLREQAGNPSFRKMAEVSGAVSHATLHLTVTGRRLQPWETVREFVRACGGDEAEWCTRYRRTEAMLSGELPDGEADGTADVPQNAADAPTAGTGERGTPDADVSIRRTPEPETRRGWARQRLVAPLVLVIVAGVVFGFTLTDDENRPQETRNEAKTSTLTEPVYPGDDSALARDLGIQDGAVVRPEQQFTRTFELQNKGSVHWNDRYLQRMENASGPKYCEAPQRVPINDTAPGETVRIPVTARAAAEAPTTCKIRWKMVDGAGRQLLPAKRPVYFLVHVRDGR